MKDGWHFVAGYKAWIERGKVTRLYSGGSLYRWDKKLGCWNGILPCKPSRVRYYESKENLKEF